MDNTSASKEKIGLVMEGGSMRGMFTCGVIDVFMEHGLTFDGAAGVSAGATFGCNIKSRQIGRARRYNKEYCNDRRYASFYNLIRSGDLFDVDFCYRELPFELDPWDSGTFAANPMEFYVVVSDVETGRPVYYKCGKGGYEDIEWIRASASMPLLSHIVEIGERKFLDGGVADSIPLRFMERIGYDRNVVILTQPRGYIKKHNPLMPAARIMYGRFPNFVRAMDNRHERYNRTLGYIEKQEENGTAFVIRPPMDLDIGKMEKDPDELERVYQIGRTTAEERIGEMMEKGFFRLYENVP
ncbi:MAG: patatin family protein [Lachnospiraceae bacterium]|nr:patatin family protein [Lachnospiraceae bacterium]